MKLEIVHGPVKEPVALEEIKLYLRLDGNTEDSLIESFITSARLYCENYQKQAYYTQTLRVIYSAAEADFNMELPRSKYLQKVISVKAVLPDDTEKEVSYHAACGDVYSRVIIHDLPAGADIVVEYITGKMMRRWRILRPPLSCLFLPCIIIVFLMMRMVKCFMRYLLELKRCLTGGVFYD